MTGRLFQAPGDAFLGGDKALEWLEKAYEEHFNPSILVRPAFDPLRSDPRFQNLVHRIGLSG